MKMHQENLENQEIYLLLQDYLFKNPSCFIDPKKILRSKSVSIQKINTLFTEMENKKIGKRIYSFNHPNLAANLISHFKFFFFEFDKHAALNKHLFRPDQDGALLEQFFFSSLAINPNLNITTFRTIDNIEVDFIIKKDNQFFGVEIKKDQFIYAGDLQGLHFFDKNFSEKKELYVLHKGARETKEGKIWILPIEKGIKLFT